MGVDIQNWLFVFRKMYFLHPMMHFSTYVGSEFLLVWIVILKEHIWQQPDINSKCFSQNCLLSDVSAKPWLKFFGRPVEKSGIMNLCDNWKLMLEDPKY